MARSRSASSLADLIPKVLKGLQADSRPDQETIQGIWSRLAGKQAAQHSWPRVLRGGQLIVEVDSSGWMYTLNLKKTQLLEGLVKKLGAAQMKSLSFRIGEKRSGE